MQTANPKIEFDFSELITFECETFSNTYQKLSKLMDDLYHDYHLGNYNICSLNQIQSILFNKINKLLSKALISSNEARLLTGLISRTEKKTTSPDLIDALDLHVYPKNRYITHSTWLINRLTTNKTSLAISLLLDSTPKCIKSIELSKRFIPDSPRTALEMKTLYSEIISKFLRQQDNDAVFQQIISEHKYVEPVMRESQAKYQDMMMRIWFSNQDGQITSRLLYICSHQQTESIALYYQMFGNIDLAIIPMKENITQEINIHWYEKNQIENIAQIPAHCLINIAKYLDHGQSLNLKTLDKLHQTQSLIDYLKLHSAQISTQPMQDFYDYFSHSPNGFALLKKQDFQYIAHMTRYKKEIIESGFISTSNGGCLGNVIYSIKILENEKGLRYMPGMSLGLAARLFSNKQLEENKFFLFHIQEQGNQFSNWINNLGFGRLKLEAMLSVARHSEYMPFINKTCATSMMLYHHLTPLLDFFKDYSRSRSFSQHLSEAHLNERIIIEFNEFWSIFCQIRILPENQYHLTMFYLLNNLLFEVLKDYILLHQKTKDQEIFNLFGSYDMHNQYEFFFNVDPYLRQSGFKTELFSPDYHEILHHLEAHQAIDTNRVEEIIAFKKFMLNRFSAAINQFYLENHERPKKMNMSSSIAIYSFMELANHLPNLMGNIFHGILTKNANLSSLETHLIQEYHSKLRELFGLSYDTRNITVPIKANLFETDEVGARSLENTTLHDIVLEKNNDALYQVKDISPPHTIKIKGVSTRIQLRSKECEENHQATLSEMTQLFNNPIEEWSQGTIVQFNDLFNHHKYTTTKIEEAGILHHLQSITQKICLQNMPLNQLEMIDLQLKSTQLIVDILSLINIKNFDLACEKLDNFSINHQIPLHELIELLLDNKKNASPLYLASMLFFVSRYYLISQESNNKYVQYTLELSQLVNHDSDIKIKNLYTQVLINLRRKNIILDSQLIIHLLHHLEKNPCIDVYHEISHFLRFEWMTLSKEEIVFFANFLLNIIDNSQQTNSILNALANMSVLPYLSHLFLKINVIKNLVLYPNPYRYESILKILGNVSSATEQERKLLPDSTFAFLLFVLEHAPRLSHQVFYILNHLLSSLKGSEIKQILDVIEYAVVQEHDILSSADSFFENLLIHKNKTIPSLTDLKLKYFSFNDIEPDDMNILMIEFISLSYQLFDITDSVIQNTIKIIIDRLKKDDIPHLKYYKALNRLLENPQNRTLFLELNGLQTMILSSAQLTKLPSESKMYRDLANDILNILSRFSAYKLNIDNIHIESLEQFYACLFIDSDLIAELTAFILKFEFGGHFISQKLSSLPLNTESQINIITGLAEIEMTSEICLHITHSPLCNTVFSLLEHIEEFSPSLHHVMAQTILNLFSRKILRDQYLNPTLFEKMKLILIDEKNEPDLYEQWHSFLKKINHTEPAIDLFLLTPQQLIEQIILGSYAINEIPLVQKQNLIQTITGLLDTMEAAIALEILARNKHYSNLLSHHSMLCVMKEKLEQPTCLSTIKVFIIDSLFWLTVNNHRNTNRIINTITLPLLLKILTSSESSDDIIRATLGLMVNAEFTDENNQTLLPFLELFIHFLQNKNQKVIINTLQLLESLACVPHAFNTLDEENRIKLYEQFKFLKDDYPDIIEIQTPIETLFETKHLFSDSFKSKMDLFEQHLSRSTSPSLTFARK